MWKKRAVPFNNLDPVISISDSLIPRVIRLDWQDCPATLFSKKKDAKSCYFPVSDESVATILNFIKPILDRSKKF